MELRASEISSILREQIDNFDEKTERLHTSKNRR